MDGVRFDNLARRLSRRRTRRSALTATVGLVVSALARPFDRPAAAQFDPGCGFGGEERFGRCVDTQNDENNCGGCGNACPVGTRCSVGQCTCGPFQHFCGFGCTDVSRDRNNCGACGVACPQGTQCSGGQCGCVGAFQQFCGFGCTDVSTDPRNCGGCGLSCPPRSSCWLGECTCDVGLTACGNACADVASDPANCGACNRRCRFHESCVEGVCVVPCGPGRVDCGGECVFLTSSDRHCGRCFAPCAGGSCVGGTCIPAGPEPSGGAARYELIDLGTGGGDWSVARRVNARGQVLFTWATALDPDLDQVKDAHAAVWEEGRLADLADLGMEWALGIDDLGLVYGVVGGAVVAADPFTGSVAPVAGFPAGGRASAVGPTGAIAGTVDGRVVVVADGEARDLPAASGYEGLSMLAAVNAAGEAAGAAQPALIDFDEQRAVVLTTDGAVVIGPAPGATGSAAADLNDRGLVVGHPERAGVKLVLQGGRAFAFDRATGEMHDLGTIPGYGNSAAQAVNDDGLVVGFSWLPETDAMPFRVAFRYDHRSRRMENLNDLVDAPGWVLTDAFDVNDRGGVVGRGVVGGQVHAFLLRPNAE